MEKKFKVITVALIYNEFGEILLGKRSLDEDVFPGHWAIPGGKVELDGAQEKWGILEENLNKEIMEEIGITITDISYLNSHYGYNEGEYKIYIAFTAKHKDGTIQALEDTTEVGYFKPDDAIKMHLTPGVDVIIRDYVRLLCV